MRAEHLHFEVVDSLLGDFVEYKEAGLKFRPPAGFEPIGDSLFAAFRKKVEAEIPPQLKIRPASLFYDRSHDALIMASLLPHLDDSAMAVFLTTYATDVKRVFPTASIKEGEFRVDDVEVKNLLILDSLMVRFHLVCRQHSGGGLELRFISPRRSYAELLKSFESSIGSISTTKKGGM